MNRATSLITLFVLAALATGSAVAQSSTSFTLESTSVNAGGHPDDGTRMTSLSYTISLDAVGAMAMEQSSSGASFTLTTGSSATYAPPREVDQVLFPGPDTLTWNTDAAAGSYNLYRGGLLAIGVGASAECHRAGIGGNVATGLTPPPAGEAYFYLVTSENLLHEEGTTGFAGGGIERTNPTPCP